MNLELKKVLETLPKPTPTLTGRDAKRFIESLGNPKPVSREAYLRAKHLYESVSNNTVPLKF